MVSQKTNEHKCFYLSNISQKKNSTNPFATRLDMCFYPDSKAAILESMYTLIFHGAFGYHICALEMSFREKASTTMYLSQPTIYLQKLTPTNPSALMFFFKKHIHNESFVWDLRNFCEPVNGEKSIWRLHTFSTTKQFRLRQRAQNGSKSAKRTFSLLAASRVPGPPTLNSQQRRELGRCAWCRLRMP